MSLQHLLFRGSGI